MPSLRSLWMTSATLLLMLPAGPACAQFVVMQAPGSPTVLLVAQDALSEDSGRRLDQWLGPLQRELPPVADCPIIDTALLAGRLLQARRIVAVVTPGQAEALRETLRALPARLRIDQALAQPIDPQQVPEALALRSALGTAEGTSLQLLLATPGS
jgi:hypothetical protein